MPARAQQRITPVAKSWLIKLFIDELHQQCPCPLNAFRQSQEIPSDQPKQGLPKWIGLATVSEKPL